MQAIFYTPIDKTKYFWGLGIDTDRNEYSLTALTDDKIKDHWHLLAQRTFLSQLESCIGLKHINIDIQE